MVQGVVVGAVKFEFVSDNGEVDRIDLLSDIVFLTLWVPFFFKLIEFRSFFGVKALLVL